MTRPDAIDQDEDRMQRSIDESDSSVEDTKDDETSSSGSSSDEDLEDTEDDQAPSFPSHVLKTASSTTLRSRLASFIPQLQQANAELETDPDAAERRIDNVADDEDRYIEMSLGLGVLKTKSADDLVGVKTTLSEDSGSSDEDSKSEDETKAAAAELDIIDRLKRVRPVKRKVEEVG